MSNIEWTDSTWNPVIGCRHVAEGCRHCYAETMSKRLAAMGQKDYASILDAKGKFNGKAITRPQTLAEPLHWKKPRMVFVNSMSDLFHEDVPFEFIAAVFGVMAACPQHTFQVLTKRPERALEFFRWSGGAADIPGSAVLELWAQCAMNKLPKLFGNPDAWYDATIARETPLKNVWLGVSIATQADADKNIPVLLKCPASVRFVSAEPLLESVDLRPWLGNEVIAYGEAGRVGITEFEVKPPRLHWVIVGGESGPGARSCDVAWIRSIVEECKLTGIACFVKQLGAHVLCAEEDAFANASDAAGIDRWHALLKDSKGGNPDEWPEDLRVREFPKERAHA